MKPGADIFNPRAQDSIFLGVDPDAAWLVGRVNRQAQKPEHRWIIESSSSFVVHPPKIDEVAGAADGVDGGADKHDAVPGGGGPPGGTSGRGGIPRELRNPMRKQEESGDQEEY